MRYRYNLVDRIPPQMEEAIIYHAEEFGLAGLLCACGCGHRITLIVPESHRVRNEGGYATIVPSVGVMDAPCKSHFIVNAGEVRWYPSFSEAYASRVMHAQIARHVVHDERRTWWQRLKTVARGVLERLATFFVR